MILNVIHTNKDLFSSSFVVKRGQEEIGTISLQGRLGSMEAYICGTFYDTQFEMTFGMNECIESSAFRPYLIKQSGNEVGAVYQTKYNGGILKKYDFHQMIKSGVTYNLFSIDLGKEGSKCPIYSNSKQIAQIEKPSVVYNDLHDYKVYALDEKAGLISVMFCLYLYISACYKPGQKMVRSTSKTISRTTNKYLKEKYSPHFIENILE